MPSQIKRRKVLVPTGLSILPVYEEIDVRIDVFDPKKDIIDDLKLLSSRVYEWDSAAEAAHSALGSEENGILVIEELLCVPKREYNELRKACALRRRDTTGQGIFIVATTQRPRIMPVEFRAMADEWLVGQITEPSDLRAIGDVIGHKQTDDMPCLKVGQFKKFLL